MSSFVGDIEQTDDEIIGESASAPPAQDSPMDQPGQLYLPSREVSINPSSPTIRPVFDRAPTSGFSQSHLRPGLLPLSRSGSPSGTGSEDDRSVSSNTFTEINSDVDEAGNNERLITTKPGVISFNHLSGLGDAATSLPVHHGFHWPATDLPDVGQGDVELSVWESSSRGIFLDHDDLSIAGALVQAQSRAPNTTNKSPHASIGDSFKPTNTQVAATHTLAMLRMLCPGDIGLNVGDILPLIKLPDIKHGQLLADTPPNNDNPGFDSIGPQSAPVDMPQTLNTDGQPSRKRKASPLERPSPSKQPRRLPSASPNLEIDESTLVRVVQAIDPLYWSTTAIGIALRFPYGIGYERTIPVGKVLIDHISATATDGLQLLVYTTDESLQEANITQRGQKALRLFIREMRRRSSGYRSYCHVQRLQDNLCPTHITHLREGEVRAVRCSHCTSHTNGPTGSRARTMA